MSTSNVIGTVQVASGDIKIIALDGTSRDAVYGDYVYEGEQIISTDPASLFQINYLEQPEAKAYSGVFKIMADGTAVAEAEEGDVDIFETAAGEEGVESNSQNIEDNPTANVYEQTFGRSTDASPFPAGTGAGDVKDDGSDVFNDQPEVDDIVLGLGEDTRYESHDGEDPQNGEDDTQDDVLSMVRGTMAVADDDIADTHLFDVKDTTEDGFVSTLDTTADGYNLHVDTLVEDDDGLTDGVVDAPVSVVVESSDIDASLIDVTKITLLNNDAGDRTVDFVLEGDFNALAAGETATVTFTYTATDDNLKTTEPNESEPATVTITVTGTNDQPIAAYVPVEAVEAEGPGATVVSGVMSATDDDVNNTHIFDVKTMGGEDSWDNYDSVEYYKDGPDGGSEDITVQVYSSYIDPDYIDVTKITLLDNDGADSSTGFELEGDFNALAVGETATIVFQYTADDTEGYGKYGGWNSEASVSEPKTVTITVTGTNDVPFFTVDGRTGLEFVSQSAGYANVLGIYVLDEFGNPSDPQIVMTDTHGGGDPSTSMLDYEFGSFGLFIIPNGDYVPGGIENATLSFNPSDPTQLLINDSPVTVYYDNNEWNPSGLDHFDIVDNGDGSFNIRIEDLHPNGITLGDNDRNDLVVRLTPNGDSVGGTVVELVDETGSDFEHSLTGTLGFDDLDLSDIHDATAEPSEDGYLGSFTVSVTDPATGPGDGEVSWNFEVEDSQLDSLGRYDSLVQTYTVTVDDGHGGTDTQDVVITIQGTNDRPIVLSEDITKVADHILGEDIVEPVDVDAITFSSVCHLLSDDAEVKVLKNGSYAVDDQNNVRFLFFTIYDGDKENFVDSKGFWNEGLIFNFENDVESSTISLSNIDTNDRVLVKLYDAGGNEVHNVGVLDLHSGPSSIVVDEGVSFRSIGIFALDTWSHGRPETEFRVSSVTALDVYEIDTVLDFVIDDAMLLENDTDVEGDELEVQLTGDTNVYLGTEVVGSVSINGDGDIQVTMNDTPETYEDGATLTFSYVVSDGIDISDPATVTINVQHGDIDGVEVSYDQTSGEFIIGTDLGNEAMPENVLTVDDTLDLSDVSSINTIELGSSATVTGSSDLGHINPSDVLGATDSDNRLVIQSSDGVAADQVDVHESFGDPVSVEIGGVDYAQYSDGTATLLVQVDEPIDVV